MEWKGNVTSVVSLLWLAARLLIEHLTHQIERERFNGYALTVAINLRHSY